MHRRHVVNQHGCKPKARGLTAWHKHTIDLRARAPHSSLMRSECWTATGPKGSVARRAWCSVQLVVVSQPAAGSRSMGRC